MSADGQSSWLAASTEELVASGHEIARDNAFAMYFYRKQIMIACAKTLKQVKKTISFHVNFTGDKCRSTNEWSRVEYVLTPKSNVQANSEFAPLKDAMGKAIQHVWGYEQADCETKLACRHDGAAKT